MTYTSHGHHIDGTIKDDNRPLKVARCGGPGLCDICSKEAMYALQTNKDYKMIEPIKYVRKPFEVEAVEVTEETMDEVSAWCRGNIKTDAHERPYIKVRVARALNERQTKAYVGDWVLYAGTGYKVYTQKAFNKSFEPLDMVFYSEEPVEELLVLADPVVEPEDA